MEYGITISWFPQFVKIPVFLVIETDRDRQTDCLTFAFWGATTLTEYFTTAFSNCMRDQKIMASCLYCTVRVLLVLFVGVYIRFCLLFIRKIGISTMRAFFGQLFRDECHTYDLCQTAREPPRRTFIGS
jgi:hypothetical protein